jgi:hypothetical protein
MASQGRLGSAEPLKPFVLVVGLFWRTVAKIGNCTDDRIESFNPWFQRLLRSSAPTTHAKPSQLLVDNGPLGSWADLYVESRNRGTEAKGPSLRQLRAVDTPPSVGYGSYAFPFRARRLAWFAELSGVFNILSKMLLYI